MKPALRSSLGVLPFLVLAACESTSEPRIDPCDGDFACLVEGVDVAIVSVVPRWTAAQPYEAQAGAHVVEPGDQLVVDVIVANRGTVAGTGSIEVAGRFRDFQHLLSAETTIQPLGVGEQTVATLTFSVPEGARWLREWYTEQGTYTVAEGSFELSGAFEAEDADPSNHAGTAAYQPRAPLLEIARLDLGDFHYTTHVDYEWYVDVANHSPFVDYAGGDEIVFCNHEVAHAYCEMGLLESHSPTLIGPVAAAQDTFFATTLRFTPESLWYFDSENYVQVAACLPDGIQSDHYTAPRCLQLDDFSEDFDTYVTVDLAQACDAQTLAPPDTLASGTSSCVITRGGDFAQEYTIGTVQGMAGECLRITPVGADDVWFVNMRNAALRLVSRDGDANCYPIAEDGSYYVVAREFADAETDDGTFFVEPI